MYKPANSYICPEVTEPGDGCTNRLAVSVFAAGAHWLVRVLDMIVSGSTQYRAGHSFDHIMMDLQDLQLVNNLDPPARPLHPLPL